MLLNKEEIKEVSKLEELPVFVINNAVVHPFINIKVQAIDNADGQRWIQTFKIAQHKHNGYFLMVNLKKEEGKIHPDNFLPVATLCRLTSLNEKNEMTYESKIKFIIKNTSEMKNKIILAKGQPVLPSIEEGELTQVRQETLKSFINHMNDYNLENLMMIQRNFNLTTLPAQKLVSIMASFLDISLNEQKNIQKETNLKSNFHYIKKLIEELEGDDNFVHEKMDQELNQKVRREIDQSERTHFLKIKKDIIDRELGLLTGTNTNESEVNPVKEMYNKINKTYMPRETKKIAEKEFSRLRMMSPQSSEYHVIENYLNTLIDYPWNKSSPKKIDLKKAREILESDHYGLDKVKKRILEYLAIKKLNPNGKATILCLAGPPGVGKTSICKSIAKSMNLTYKRIGLGGMHDEAEIRGHRRTYVGSMPGKIIQNILKSKVNNPLIVLDEIDKIGQSHRGSVESALLEVLDPSQNNEFNDHFMGTPVDLSQITFIATANDISQISGPLRDRLEIINLSGYTPNEKLEIATRYLCPQEQKSMGMNKATIKWEDGSILSLINHYTREAGVRKLRQQIASVYRACAVEFLDTKNNNFTIDQSKVFDILGNERLPDNKIKDSLKPGISTGLAWTPFGGEVLYVESLKTEKGSGQLKLTGQLGDVMKESANIAFTWLKTKHDFDYDIHVHFPAGAIPKDGPSAGIALASALYSLVKNKALDSKLAMTGEMSLSGEVLGVGGIKEKVMGAHRAGIKHVLLPESNQKDLSDIPQEIKNELKISLVKDVEEVLELIFKNN